MNAKIRYEFLDGLRGIAAIIVVIFHCFALSSKGQLLPFGGLAVDFFFCLSGFVVCHAYETRLNEGMLFKDFLKVRILRLYPMILIGISIGVFATLFRIYNENHSDWVEGLLLTIPINLLLLPSPFLTMGWSVAWPINSPHWSITFEIIANLFFAKYLFKSNNQRLLVVTMAAGVLLLCQIKLYGFDVGYLLNQFHLGLIRVMFPFLLGVLIYRYKQEKELNIIKQIVGKQAAPWSLLLLILFLCNPIDVKHERYFAILFIFIASPLIVYLGSITQIRSRYLGVVRLLGVISYPLYAVHMPFLRVIQSLNIRYQFDTLNLVILFAIACIISTIVAYMLTIKVEPIVKRKLSDLFSKIE